MIANLFIPDPNATGVRVVDTGKYLDSHEVQISVLNMTGWAQIFTSDNALHAQTVYDFYERDFSARLNARMMLNNYIANERGRNNGQN